MSHNYDRSTISVHLDPAEQWAHEYTIGYGRNERTYDGVVKTVTLDLHEPDHVTLSVHRVYKTGAVTSTFNGERMELERVPEPVLRVLHLALIAHEQAARIARAALADALRETPTGV